MNDAECNRVAQLRPAQADDFAAICRLLDAADNPSQDLSERGLEQFVVCEAASELVGVVGLEPYGQDAWVRSLAVAQPWRSRGMGARLLQDVERRARGLGIGALFALTTSAQTFLEKHGFTPIERDRIPVALQASAQFSGLCPESARCLTKTLQTGQPLRQSATIKETVASRSAALFDSGYLCAESVLLAIAEARGVDCALIPQIAAGFCSGVARSCGMCGALSGAILSIGLGMGRASARESADAAYDAVRFVRDRFESEFGSSDCLSLTGCDLGTAKGQLEFQKRRVHATCTRYVRRAAEWAVEAMNMDQPTDKP